MDKSRPSSLEKAIISTLCFFDISDYPLTLMEIWKWLWAGSGLRAMGSRLIDIQQILDCSEFLKERVELKDGFYFLKGREEIVTTRKERYNFAEPKFQKTIKIIRLLRFVPFVKMIAVCNTLAYSNSRQKADIDLFVITKRQRVWQTRFWITGFLKICGLRPSPKKTQDTFCPSFYLDEDNLNLEKLALENDIYLPYWITQVFPVYDEGSYEQFIKANQWVKEKLTNFSIIQPSSRRKVNQAGLMKKILTLFSSFLPESLFRNYQIKIMPARLKEMANQDSRVIVQDTILKFHDDDRRKEFKNRFEQRLAGVINV